MEDDDNIIKDNINNMNDINDMDDMDDSYGVSGFDEEGIRFFEKDCFEEDGWMIEELQDMSRRYDLPSSDSKEELCANIYDFFVENYKDKKGSNPVKERLNIKLMGIIKSGGIDVNEKNEEGDTILMYILKKYENFSKEMVDIILERKPDINVKNNDGDTVIMVAFRNSMKIPDEIEMKLLELNPDLNIQNKAGDTALTMGIIKDGVSDEILLRIIKTEGVDVNIKNYFGDTALILSLISEISDDIRVELISRSDINTKEDDIEGDGNDILMLAIDNKSSGKVYDEILKKDVNLNAQNKYGYTSLMMAILFSRTKTTNSNTYIINKILDRKPDINIQSRDGLTALMHATTNTRYIKKDDILRIMSMGADINKQDNQGITALMYYIENNDNIDEDIINKFIEIGIDYKKRTNVFNNTNKEETLLSIIRRNRSKIPVDSYTKLRNEIIKAQWGEIRSKTIVYDKKYILKWQKACANLEKIELKEIQELAKLEKIDIYKSKEDICVDFLKKFELVSRENEVFYEIDKLCVDTSKRTIEEFQELAKKNKIGIEKSKRELCRDLAKKYEKKISEKRECINSDTILGDDVNLIPQPLLYIIKENSKNYCFNIIELKEQIERGTTINPYTRKELPVDKINKKYKKLQKTLVENKLELSNILEQIKNSEIMTEESIMSLKATNLAGMLEYVNHNMIMNLRKEQIEDIFEMMIENPIFQIVRGIEFNLKNLIDESLRVLSIEDSLKITRRAALGTYIRDIYG